MKGKSAIMWAASALEVAKSTPPTVLSRPLK